MAKIETTAEFVLELHKIVGSKGQEMIKNEFPVLFTFNWEKDKWYRLTWDEGRAVAYVLSDGTKDARSGGTKGIGIHNGGRWDDAYDGFWGGASDVWKELMTKEEVEAMLWKEAEKRGYKKGVTISYGDRKGVIIGDFYWARAFDCLAVPTELITNPTENPFLPIFKNGKWSEIAVDPNKEIKESIQRLEKELAELKSKVK